jgi:signal transduction histidine kinase
VQASPGADARIALRVVRRGELVVVEVEDNGSGIPDDVAAHIFEPFFTTKGENGLGLGLDISRKIVEEHGGRLDFTSRVGVGTTFRVAVPAKRDETG